MNYKRPNDSRGGSRRAVNQGRSFLLVDIDVADVFEAVAEFIDCEHVERYLIVAAPRNL